ncbi:MAG: outer membrane protein transport protein, partial [Rhodocyclaceae bacterium]|nr:outer membrane protein transport protein [Rhodocyclaceae bacterium]
MNPLFPATIKNHLTLGFGYAFNPVSSIDFSLVHAPKVTVSNSNMGGVTTSHSQQTNWQFMYSHRF